MKKVLFIFASILILSTTSHAQTCIGGTIITGRDPNRSFCLSDKTMNWWTAHQWCAGNGRTLAHPDKLCNYNGEGWFLALSGCPNLIKTGYWPNSMWTSLPINNDQAIFYQYNNILTKNSRLGGAAAVCE